MDAARPCEALSLSKQFVVTAVAHSIRCISFGLKIMYGGDLSKMMKLEGSSCCLLGGSGRFRCLEMVKNFAAY